MREANQRREDEEKDIPNDEIINEVIMDSLTPAEPLCRSSALRRHRIQSPGTHEDGNNKSPTQKVGSATLCRSSALRRHRTQSPQAQVNTDSAGGVIDVDDYAFSKTKKAKKLKKKHKTFHKTLMAHDKLKIDLTTDDHQFAINENYGKVNNLTIEQPIESEPLNDKRTTVAQNVSKSSYEARITRTSKDEGTSKHEAINEQLSRDLCDSDSKAHTPHGNTHTLASHFDTSHIGSSSVQRTQK